MLYFSKYFLDYSLFREILAHILWVILPILHNAVINAEIFDHFNKKANSCKQGKA